MHLYLFQGGSKKMCDCAFEEVLTLWSGDYKSTLMTLAFCMCDCVFVSSVTDWTSCFHPPFLFPSLWRPILHSQSLSLTCSHSWPVCFAVCKLMKQTVAIATPPFITLFYGLHILFGIWAVASWKGQTSQFPCQQIQSAVTLHKNIKKTHPLMLHSFAIYVRQSERGSLSACLISLHLLNVHLKVCTLDRRHLHIVSIVAA